MVTADLGTSNPGPQGAVSLVYEQSEQGTKRRDWEARRPYGPQCEGQESKPKPDSSQGEAGEMERRPFDLSQTQSPSEGLDRNLLLEKKTATPSQKGGVSCLSITVIQRLLESLEFLTIHSPHLPMGHQENGQIPLDSFHLVLSVTGQPNPNLALQFRPSKAHGSRSRHHFPTAVKEQMTGLQTVLA